MAEKSPSELTRETLKLLSARKLVPNPANFRSIYNEVAGVADLLPFPDEQLRKIVQALPERTFAQQRYKVQIEGAIKRSNWSELQTALGSYVDAGSMASAGAVAAVPQPAETTS